MLQRVFMIVVIVAIVLGGGYYAYKEIVPDPNANEAEGPLYATKEVIRGNISVGVETTGSIQSTAGGSIQVPGNYNDNTSYMVAEAFIKDGDEVNRGDIIIKLDAPDLLDEIKRTEDRMQSEIEDLANLLNISPNEIHTVNPATGITLHAPIDGRIVNLDVQEGDEVSQGQTVARVVEDNIVQLTAKVLPGDFAGIEEGQPCFLRFGQFDQLVKGKVKKVIPDLVPEKASDLIDSITMSGNKNDNNYINVYWVEVELENAGLIRPDMIAQVGFMPSKDTVPENFDTFNAVWTRYFAEVEGYANEERILSRAEAIATRVYVNNMQRVKAGDPIVSLAGEDARNLIREHLNTIREYEDDLRQMYNKLDQLDITSPMTGIVAHISAEPGSSVQAGQYLGHIFNTERMGMYVQVDDIQVLNVQQGAEVDVSLPAMPGEIFFGEVTHVSAGGVDHSGVPSFYVSIELEGGQQMRPGMQANAYIKGGSAEDVLLIPVEAVFEEYGQYKVEVLHDDNQIEVVEVELGLIDNRFAEVISGLEEGDQVVVGSADDILQGRSIDDSTPFQPSQPDNGGQN